MQNIIDLWTMRLLHFRACQKLSLFLYLSSKAFHNRNRGTFEADLNEWLCSIYTKESFHYIHLNYSQFVFTTTKKVYFELRKST